MVYELIAIAKNIWSCQLYNFTRGTFPDCIHQGLKLHRGVQAANGTNLPPKRKIMNFWKAHWNFHLAALSKTFQWKTASLQRRELFRQKAEKELLRVWTEINLRQLKLTRHNFPYQGISTCAVIERQGDFECLSVSIARTIHSPQGNMSTRIISYQTLHNPLTHTNKRVSRSASKHSKAESVSW